MAHFRIEQVGELATQMQFTPADSRLAQIDAAERLLLEIDPATAYPFTFVLFRITGYHAKTIDETLLTGLALQHDLGLLIERVSDGLNLAADGMNQPVLSIDEVSARFNVTSKTIQRWRRKGLSARRFVFADGKKRVGFLVGSVERFLSRHAEQAIHAANFSAVNEAELEAVLRLGRRLARDCDCCREQVIRRIGKKLNRSELAIAHLIDAHDQAHEEDAVFGGGSSEPGERERARIVRGHARGVSIRALERQTGRTRSAIYQVLMEERLARLNRRKVKFIDDTLYHQPDARQVVETIVATQPDNDSNEALSPPREMAGYLQSLYRVPLLSAGRERALFLKFNFEKFLFVTQRRRLDPQWVNHRALDALERLRGWANGTKNQIVAANLRLVVNVARKHMRPGLSLMELISDGNLTLMRAVESYDFHKGNRFSTYATLALMKGFARSVGQMLAARNASSGAAMLGQVAQAGANLAVESLTRRDQVQQMLQRLSEPERHVLSRRFGLAEDAEPVTFDEIARHLGLSKHRVKQIEQTALEKLRERGEP